MQTLAEHNKAFRERLAAKQANHDSAGVVCNGCNTEMIVDDSRSSSNWPSQQQVAVICPMCGFRGIVSG